jgi:two-component system, response regulator PdtaR
MGRLAEESLSGKEARPRVILVADDDILVRSTVAEYLRTSGYTVLEAANAEEAIAVLASGEPVDAVFSDVQMSGPTDGLIVAGWIDQHHPDIPVMLTSGNRNLLLDATTDRVFVSKPYRLAEVANRVGYLLGEGP